MVQLVKICLMSNNIYLWSDIGLGRVKLMLWTKKSNVNKCMPNKFSGLPEPSKIFSDHVGPRKG